MMIMVLLLLLIAIIIIVSFAHSRLVPIAVLTKNINKSCNDSKLNIMDCLSFTKGNCCPHYDEESERRPSLSKFIKNNEMQNCYAIEGGSALHIKNDKVHYAISFRGKKNSYLVEYEDKKIKENVLPLMSIK